MSASKKRRPGRPSKYPPEFRRDAVELVLDEERQIADVARSLGINEGTLGNWVNLEHKARADPTSAAGAAGWSARPHQGTGRSKHRVMRISVSEGNVTVAVPCRVAIISLRSRVRLGGLVDLNVTRVQVAGMALWSRPWHSM